MEWPGAGSIALMSKTFGLLKRTPGTAIFFFEESQRLLDSFCWNFGPISVKNDAASERRALKWMLLGDPC